MSLKSQKNGPQWSRISLFLRIFFLHIWADHLFNYFVFCVYQGFGALPGFRNQVRVPRLFDPLSGIHRVSSLPKGLIVTGL